MSHTRLCLSLLTISATLAACGEPAQNKASDQAKSRWFRSGWHYLADDKSGIKSVIYRFADKSNNRFMAHCDGGTVIFVFDHPILNDPTATPVLEIDGNRWKMNRNVEFHSGDIVTDTAEWTDRFGQAKRRIAFSVGAARIQFAPSRLIGKLIDGCRAKLVKSGKAGRE